MCGVVLHFKLLRNKALYWGGGGEGGGGIEVLSTARGSGDSHRKGWGYSSYLMFRKAVLEPHEDVQPLNVHNGSFYGTF